VAGTWRIEFTNIRTPEKYSTSSAAPSIDGFGLIFSRLLQVGAGMGTQWRPVRLENAGLMLTILFRKT